MRKAAGDRGLMTRALQAAGDGLVADGAGEVRAPVENPIRGINGLGIVGCAGIGAWRVAGDQIVDFQPILDGADTPFQAQFLFNHDRIPRIVNHAGNRVHYPRLRYSLHGPAVPVSDGRGIGSGGVS